MQNACERRQRTHNVFVYVLEGNFTVNNGCMLMQQIN